TVDKARGFTAVCATSLGLGKGGVILILLFMPSLIETPPADNYDGLVVLGDRPGGQQCAEAGEVLIVTWSFVDYIHESGGACGSTITGWSRGEGYFRPADESRAISLSTMYVSSNYFSTIGVTLPLGRGFTAVDDASRAEPEAVIEHRLWQVRFEGDPAIVGRAITINGTEYVVVGVAPEGFRGIRGSPPPRTPAWIVKPGGSASSRGCRPASGPRRRMQPSRR